MNEIELLEKKISTLIKKRYALLNIGRFLLNEDNTKTKKEKDEIDLKLLIGISFTKLAIYMFNIDKNEIDIFKWAYPKNVDELVKITDAQNDKINEILKEFNESINK